MRALDLFDDRAPDAADGHAAPFERCGGGADVGLGDAAARTCSLTDAKSTERSRASRCSVSASSGSEPTTATIGSAGSGASNGGIATERSSCSPGAPISASVAPIAAISTVLGEDPEHDAGHRRADLDRRLVGLDLDDRLVLDHRIALAHEPAGDLALGQPLAQLRQRERVCHDRQRSG